MANIDRRLGNDRQIHRDPVPASDTQVAQGVGQACDFEIEFAIAQGTQIARSPPSAKAIFDGAARACLPVRLSARLEPASDNNQAT